MAVVCECGSFGRSRLLAPGARSTGFGAAGVDRRGAKRRWAVRRDRGELPVSARRACSPRGGRLPARRGCEYLPPAAASSRASLRTGSSVSCSSRCWRPPLRISGRSCSPGPPRWWSRCSEPRSTQPHHMRPQRAPSRSFTASTGSPPTWPFNGRQFWRSTICTGRTAPPCGGSST